MHLHAVIILDKKCNIVGANSLDLEHDGKQYHGSYEPMKGPLLKACNYVTKHDTDPILHNIDLVALAHATKSKKKLMAKEVMEGKNLAKCVIENPEYLFDYHNMQRSTQSFKLSVE